MSYLGTTKDGRLHVQVKPTHRPIPDAVSVTVNGEIVAWLTVEEVERTAAYIAELKAAISSRSD